jgi:hypothetical protein
MAAEYSPSGDHLYDFTKPINEARIDLGHSNAPDLPFVPSHLDGRTLAVLSFDGWKYRLVASGHMSYDGETMTLLTNSSDNRSVTVDELSAIRPVSPKCRIPQCQGFDFFLLIKNPN